MCSRSTEGSGFAGGGESDVAEGGCVDVNGIANSGSRSNIGDEEERASAAAINSLRKSGEGQGVARGDDGLSSQGGVASVEGGVSGVEEFKAVGDNVGSGVSSVCGKGGTS